MIPLILIIVGVAALILKGKKPMNEIGVFNTYIQPAQHEAHLTGVSVSLILAIIMQESKGAPTVTGNANEIGLMQITPIALAEYNRFASRPINGYDLFDVETNIHVGTWTFKHVRNQTDNDYEALRAYNAGVNGARNNPDLSKDYAESVLKYQMKFNSLLSA